MQHLDQTDRHILAILQADGKLSYQELGEAVGLSAPAAFQRVRKLESAGVIAGYHARVDPQAAGKPLIAFVHVHPPSGGKVPQLLAGWRRTPAVLECHRLTGSDHYLLKVRLENLSALGEFLDGARGTGCTVESELAVETAFERWVV